MSLASREKNFQQLVSRFECRKHSPLIVSHRIDPALFERLRVAASSYLLRCLPDQSKASSKLLSDEEALLAEFSRQMSVIKNVTPNGIVVPKREFILEYNAFVSAFAQITKSLRIGDLIDFWVNPPNLRFKNSEVSEKLLARSYASEHTHTEAWIPLNTRRCFSVFIPILGDAERNRVEFYTPPSHFDESWLDPQNSYKEGAEIAANYSKIEVPYEKGTLVVTEVATMHATKRLPASGPRISIDVNVIYHAEKEDKEFSECDRPRQSTLEEIGQTKLYVYLDSVDEFIDTQGGQKHVTQNRKLISL